MITPALIILFGIHIAAAHYGHHDFEDDQLGLEEYGHHGYGHDGYGHDGYGHDGYGHEGHGHGGYGHGYGHGHEGYGHEDGHHGPDGYENDDEIDGYHTSERELHADIDGNLLHNNMQYDHIDDAGEGTHLEHELLHNHEHNPHNDLDRRNFHEDILTPEEMHDVEKEVVETHHVGHGHAPAHSHYGTMLDHDNSIDYLHDPRAEGQGHELGVDSLGPANGHSHVHGYGDHHHHDDHEHGRYW